MPSAQLLIGKIAVLKKERAAPQQELDIRLEKLGRLRRRLAIETDENGKIKLETEIAEEETSIGALKEKLAGLDAEIAQAQADLEQTGQPSAETQAAYTWEDLYKALLRLDFFPQVNQFQRFVEAHHIGAFLVHGIPDGAQDWLLHRLGRYIPHCVNALIYRVDLLRMARRNQIETLWGELGSRTKMTGPQQPLEIAKTVSELWQKQSVILIFDNLDELTQQYANKLIQEFWLPLAEQACSAPPCDYRLLMFLIDNRGRADKWNVGFVEAFDPPWRPHIPLKLPRITRMPANILVGWIENAHDDLPRKLTLSPQETAKLVLENSHNGVPREVLERIIRDCGFNWYENESKWKVL